MTEEQLMNEARAAWADMAVRTFAREVQADITEPDAYNDSLTDLLADLLHLAEQQQMDVLQLLANAVLHYASERDDVWTAYAAGAGLLQAAADRLVVRQAE